MNHAEETACFACESETLFGILARPEQPAAIGVVIIVGGPQTRVGSHRQFVLLSRALASAGFPVLRFDYRGMGDSTGAQRNFEQITPDIRAAIEALQAHCPEVRQVVLWGLCDAAAAALLYCDATHDQRITGLCLLNPWVRSEASLARTQVKHYYGQRLLQKEFWLKLLSGKLNVASALRGFAGKLRQAATKVDANPGFQERMARALRDFSGRTLLLLSGNDYTAREFLEFASTSESWHGLLDRGDVTRIVIGAADHTFSSQEWRETVENACLDWLKRYD